MAATFAVNVAPESCRGEREARRKHRVVRSRVRARRDLAKTADLARKRASNCRGFAHNRGRKTVGPPGLALKLLPNGAQKLVWVVPLDPPTGLIIPIGNQFGSTRRPECQQLESEGGPRDMRQSGDLERS